MQAAEKPQGLIGKNLPWKLIEKEACRIKYFTSLAEIKEHKIVNSINFMPYGLLTVESPKLPYESLMPITHKIDFHNSWEIFKVRQVEFNEEVLVLYVPFYEGLRKVFNPILPKLHFYIYPKGHLEEMYYPQFKPSDTRTWFSPIARLEPKGYKS